MAIKIKNAKQIEGIRNASRLAAECLKYLEQFVVEGVTTKELDTRAAEFMKKHNARSATLGYRGHGVQPFSGNICTSPNDVICHGVPNDYTLKNGDILNIDVTPILDGYFGDTCKMYTVGQISEQAQNLIDATKKSLRIGMEQCFPGNRFGNIGFEIANYARGEGYSVVYEFCGHGVGLSFHEEPDVPHSASKNSGKRMQPGMIFTIEPMINTGKARSKVDKKDGWTARTIDGGLSAQFEHTILITENGYEALTDVFGDF
ncbi:MAG: type I methionyl aminopeptidase [Flavobacteriales bacterium]|nr:type I methionyl aminopeptidase [Flavobacteriales bacterium]